MMVDTADLNNTIKRTNTCTWYNLNELFNVDTTIQSSKLHIVQDQDAIETNSDSWSKTLDVIMSRYVHFNLDESPYSGVESVFGIRSS